MVRTNGEQFEHLVEHLAVLGGDADKRLKPWRRGEAAYDRRHLDGFGAGAKDRQNAHRAEVPDGGRKNDAWRELMSSLYRSRYEYQAFSQGHRLT